MAPNPIDLITLDDLAIWANMPSIAGVTPADPNMAKVAQEAITGWSDFVYWRTGRKPGYFTGDPSNPGQLTVFTETRDGNDSNSMAVLNGPIKDPDGVLLLQVNGQQIPRSTAWNQFGWYVEANPSFIGLRSGGSFISAPVGGPISVYRFFVYGKGNVSIQYQGGYVTTPPDLLEKSLRAVNVIVSKRLREDEAGRTTPQTGAVTQYRSYPWDKDIVQGLASYTRTVLSFGS